MIDTIKKHNIPIKSSLYSVNRSEISNKNQNSIKNTFIHNFKQIEIR